MKRLFLAAGIVLSVAACSSSELTWWNNFLNKVSTGLTQLNTDIPVGCATLEAAYTYAASEMVPSSKVAADYQKFVTTCSIAGATAATLKATFSALQTDLENQ
jgi:hypothetical protein